MTLLHILIIFNKYKIKSQDDSDDNTQSMFIEINEFKHDRSSYDLQSSNFDWELFKWIDWFKSCITSWLSFLRIKNNNLINKSHFRKKNAEDLCS